MSLQGKLYVTAILLFGTVCAFVSLPTPSPTADPLLTFIVFAILATIAQLFYAEVPSTNIAYFATPVFVFAGLLLLDQQTFTVIVVLYHVIEWLKERFVDGHRLRAWYIQPFNIAVELITAALIRLLCDWLDSHTFLMWSFFPVLLKAFAAFCFVLINQSLLGIAIVLARGKHWHETGMLRLENVLSDMVLLLLGYVVAVLWEINPWLIVPALSPLVLMYRALKVPALQEEAQTDGKTGLLNARYFNRRYEEEFARAQRFNRPLAFLMGDLDYLRTINNTYGHLAGDVVIAGIGKIITQNVRSYDIAGRFGGEEYAIVLPETSLDDAIVIAERIRSEIETTEFVYAEGAAPIHATISIGIAMLSKSIQTSEELMHEADRASYQAKANGRNQIVAPVPLPEPTLLIGSRTMS
ncbi:MAG: GGDEF domain-containing protein [Roseiflexaceae bacterium]|nr:GGDEF domain-containing protein [Roseiflexaceae bacterium]